MGLFDNNDYDPYSFNDTDRPPLLRGRLCSKCGSNELFCEYRAPTFWQKLFGRKEVMVIICCDCRYEQIVDTMDKIK